jgi:hypothetical protein
LGGKWLLHGFKIAKLNLQGNPRLMQRPRFGSSLRYLKFPANIAS